MRQRGREAAGGYFVGGSVRPARGVMGQKEMRAFGLGVKGLRGGEAHQREEAV